MTVDNSTPYHSHSPRITKITVSNSESSYTQKQVLERLGLGGDEFAERIFKRCGVERRDLNLSDDFLAKTLQGRSDEVEREILRHSIRAVDALEIRPEKVGVVVSSSLYSLGCPTLAHSLVERYKLNPTTDKYHVTGVGCASAVPLMRLAAQALRERPHEHALVVAAESMSGVLMRATPEDARAKTVGSAIFGDGCAAALLSSDDNATGPMILASQTHQIRDTLDAVSLEIDEADSYLGVTRELPSLAGAGMSEIVDKFLSQNRLERSEIKHWIVHPGGRRIIENVETALGLSEEDTASSWDTLADYGNVGTPTIFYVLKDMIERREPKEEEYGLMVTIGPGVTIGLMLLGW